MRYVIGIDSGISSVGWATLLLDENDNIYKIDKMDARIFDKAENDKDGASLALPRREARGSRRRLRRHRHRVERLKNLFEEIGLIDKKVLEDIFTHTDNNKDIYALRVDALDRKLNNEEFARVLIHLSQRRGFKSNRKVDSLDAKTGLLLNAVNENNEKMLKEGYRSVGEMFLKDERYKEHKRNKSEEYTATVLRSDVQKEVELIFASQRSFDNPYASEEYENRIMDIIFSQRAFDLGPGNGSKYAGNQIEKMIGYCTFEKEERRAPKATYTFEYFKLLTDINHFTISCCGNRRTLTDNERNIIKTLAFKVNNLTYARLRKELKLTEQETFVQVRYSDKTTEEAEKQKFPEMQAYHSMRLALDKIKKGYINSLNTDVLDEIGYIFTVFKNDDKIIEHLKLLKLDEDVINALLKLKGFSKFSNLSIKAMKNIIIYLQEGMTYDKAAQAAGYDFRGHNRQSNMYLKSEILSELNITNPVVKRAISQCMKQINSIIKSYEKSPVYINIEFARDMGKTKQKRDEDDKRMKANKSANERIEEEIKYLFDTDRVSGQDIVKFKLFKEQDGFCPYSMKSLDIDRVFEAGYVDIDHIIPYSLCFEDSYNNKVLVRSSENRQKKNRTAYEYMKSKNMEDDFSIWVNANVKNKRKKDKLLKASFTEEDSNEWKSRNLNDTRYIARQMKNILNDNLQFDTSGTHDKKKRVYAVNGGITAYMRKRWGLSKIRENGDLHHAVDAAAIACISDGLINKATTFCKRKESFELDEEQSNKYFPLPYPEFRKELEARTDTDPQTTIMSLYDKGMIKNYTSQDIMNVKPIMVSRMVKKSNHGAAHKETVKSGKLLEEGYTIKKTSLKNLKLDNDGEIIGYYNKKSDLLLYNALVKRLKEYNNNANEAFKERFYKPKANGENGNPVKAVKVLEKTTLNVSVYKGKGVADNGGMVRIDVFYIEGDGYYFVPIYISDTKAPKLPNKAVVAYKSYNEWKEMKDENFLFSIRHNDLIKFKAKDEKEFSLVQRESTLPKHILLNDAFVYYMGADISTASISVINHDNSYKLKGLGIKTLKKLEKYEVDYMGEIRKVEREEREYFN